MTPTIGFPSQKVSTSSNKLDFSTSPVGRTRISGKEQHKTWQTAGCKRRYWRLRPCRVRARGAGDRRRILLQRLAACAAEAGARSPENRLRTACALSGLTGQGARAERHELRTGASTPDPAGSSSSETPPKRPLAPGLTAACALGLFCGGFAVRLVLEASGCTLREQLETSKSPLQQTQLLLVHPCWETV